MPPALVLGQNTPQLSQLGKSADGEMIGIAVFQAQIMNIVEFLGAPWTNEQITECGQLAYDESYWFSLAELKQFTIRIKTGKYTSHKNFTPAVFMEFLQSYADEMHKARGDYFGNQKSSVRQIDGPLVDASDMFRQFTEVLINGGIACEGMDEDGKLINPVEIEPVGVPNLSESDYQQIRKEYEMSETARKRRMDRFNELEKR